MRQPDNQTKPFSCSDCLIVSLSHGLIVALLALLLLFLNGPLLLAAVPSEAATPKPRRPNFLIILVDDQSPFDFRFYNPRSELNSPTLDRLAAQGMIIDGAYYMGGWVGGVCTPSRTMVTRSPR